MEEANACCDACYTTKLNQSFTDRPSCWELVPPLVVDLLCRLPLQDREADVERGKGEWSEEQLVNDYLESIFFVYSSLLGLWNFMNADKSEQNARQIEKKLA